MHLSRTAAGGSFSPFNRTVYNKGRRQVDGVVHSLTTPELLTTLFGGKNSINKRIFPGNFYASQTSQDRLDIVISYSFESVRPPMV